MFRSKSKRLTRKLLIVSFFLLAVAAMLISPSPRTVHADHGVRCIDCYPLYVECLELCTSGDTCQLRCYFDYTACLWNCDPN